MRSLIVVVCSSVPPRYCSRNPMDLILKQHRSEMTAEISAGWQPLHLTALTVITRRSTLARVLKRRMRRTPGLDLNSTTIINSVTRMPPCTTCRISMEAGLTRQRQPATTPLLAIHSSMSRMRILNPRSRFAGIAMVPVLLLHIHPSRRDPCTPTRTCPWTLPILPPPRRHPLPPSLP